MKRSDLTPGTVYAQHRAHAGTPHNCVPHLVLDTGLWADPRRASVFSDRSVYRSATHAHGSGIIGVAPRYAHAHIYRRTCEEVAALEALYADLGDLARLPGPGSTREEQKTAVEAVRSALPTGMELVVVAPRYVRGQWDAYLATLEKAYGQEQEYLDRQKAANEARAARLATVRARMEALGAAGLEDSTRFVNAPRVSLPLDVVESWLTELEARASELAGG